jgi:hypothetical protein
MAIVQKTRARRDYAPLNIAASLRVYTPLSTNVQVYDTSTNTYDPNRQNTPCVISPLVVVTASDGSWRNGTNNDLLSDIKWYVNNELITTLSDWTDLYEIIEDTTELRGSIKILRNVKTSERLSLRFEAKLADTRFGTLVPVVSDEIVLATTARTEDAYTIHISESQTSSYNPLFDYKDLVEYKKAHEIAVTTEEQNKANATQNAYDTPIVVSVYKGDTLITTGFTLAIFAKGSTETKPNLSASMPTECSISGSAVTIDRRLVTEQSYWLVAAITGVDSSKYPFMQITIKRDYPVVVATPTNGTAIQYGDKMRYDKAYGNAYGQAVQYPARVMRMTWKTDTAYRTGVEHGSGDDVNINIDNAQVGTTSTDDYMDVYIESEPKGAHSVAADSSGNTYTDASGNIYIFNT